MKIYEHHALYIKQNLQQEHQKHAPDALSNWQQHLPYSVL